MAPAVPQDIRARLHRASIVRFAVALAISLFIHAVCGSGPKASSAPTSVRTLFVHLAPVNPNPPLQPAEAIADRPAMTESEPSSGPAVTTTPPVALERSRPTTVARRRAMDSAQPAREHAVDERYYEASELDRYPQLPAVGEPLRTPAAIRDSVGPLRVLVSVNESGKVDAVSFLAGNRASLARVRNALRAARFLPGEKDGRPVRSRVVIEFAGAVVEHAR
jgi:hypothetical protein